MKKLIFLFFGLILIFSCKDKETVLKEEMKIVEDFKNSQKEHKQKHHSNEYKCEYCRTHYFKSSNYFIAFD